MPPPRNQQPVGPLAAARAIRGEQGQPLSEPTGDPRAERRERFVLATLPGVLACFEPSFISPPLIAQRTVNLADALMAILDGVQPVREDLIPKGECVKCAGRCGNTHGDACTYRFKGGDPVEVLKAVATGQEPVWEKGRVGFGSDDAPDAASRVWVYLDSDPERAQVFDVSLVRIDPSREDRELDSLIERARGYQMTPEEREAQRQSFAHANVALDRESRAVPQFNGPTLTVEALLRETARRFRDFAALVQCGCMYGQSGNCPKCQAEAWLGRLPPQVLPPKTT